MLHDLSPIIWKETPHFGIRYYGMAYVLGFILAYITVLWLVKRQKFEMKEQQVADFVIYGAIGILIGARLGYCLFYGQSLFFQFRSEFPYWGVLALNEGGMSSHGAMIGQAVTCILFGLTHGISRLYLFDLVAISGPLGIFFGRIANFINGELAGRQVADTFPFAVKFPQDIYSWVPMQLDKVKELGKFVSRVDGLTREKWIEMVDKYQFDLNAKMYIQNGLVQIVEAIQNGNEFVKQEIFPMLVYRHPSQIYSALSEGLLLAIILFIYWYKPRKPGTVGCVFLICYSVVRFIGEYFREPDPHIGLELFGLTRGQWLSIVMMVVGCVFYFIWSRQTSTTVNGWGLGQNIKIGRR